MRAVHEEAIVYSGRIFEIVQQKKRINGRAVIFETARRSPGVRLLIVKNGRILITREKRSEHNGYDYRLPGGKVFDTLKEYSEKVHHKENIMDWAAEAAKRECLQETGLLPKSMRHYQTAKAGATVEWDLYYFIITDFEERSQQLEEGEDIATEWRSFGEAKQLCISGKIGEDRTVGILLRFLEASKNKFT